MAENLNYKTYDGSYCYDYNNSNCSIYGRLYNSETAKKACPAGWHLPSDAEWTELENYLGGKKLAGGKLKESGTSHWKAPNKGATNSSDFSALPGGYRFSNGNFDSIGITGYWWPSTEYSSSNTWTRALHYHHSAVSRHYYLKGNGFSVRCTGDY